MAKLHSLSNIHQLGRHNNVIDAFNFKNRLIFETYISKYPSLPNFALLP